MSAYYFKESALISIAHLMLRWPVLCFRKIGYACKALANVEEFLQGGGGVAPLNWLTLYKAEKAFYEAKASERTLLCGPCFLASEDYHVALQDAPYLFFDLGEVRTTERNFLDFRENGDGVAKELICATDNIGHMLQLTLWEICDGFFQLPPDSNPASVNWNPLRYGTEQGSLPPQGLLELADHEIWPFVPMDIPATLIQEKPALEQVKIFIISRCILGHLDPYMLAKEIDRYFPGLSDAELGKLLAADIFYNARRGSTKSDEYYKAMYENPPDVSYSAHRKRGQRLRGKAR